jgi:RNA polymerase-binding transcription factor DksA
VSGHFDSDGGYDPNRSDQLDHAAELTHKFTSKAIADARYKAKPQQAPDADGVYPHPDCVDCDEPIVPLRLQMGRIRCVDCQTRFERWSS